MDVVSVVCGKWVLIKKRWKFCVDERRGSRVIMASKKTLYEDFVSMVYEDFGLERDMFDVHLTYKFSSMSQTIAADTPPVFVCNHRQFEGYLRVCKSERLCVEVDVVGGIESVDRAGSCGVNQRKRERTGEDYKRKVVGKEPTHSEQKMEEKKGLDSKRAETKLNEEEITEAPDETKSNDEDDESRFDCCEDSDGASSADEDYCLYSKFSNVDEETNVEEKNEFGRKNRRRAHLRAKSSTPFKDSVLIEVGGVDVAVGQEYESREALESRLKIVSVLQKFDFDVDRSNPQLYTVNCWVEGCQWRIRASTIGDSPILHIRLYVKEHTCSVTERSARARQATPDILGHLYKEFVGGVGGGVRPMHVADALNLRFGLMVDYWKARRTLLCARQLVRGTAEHGYADLPTYLYRIRKANPGTYTKLEVDSEDRFKYAFIAFGACIAGFPFMRKVIVVDGTFLKGQYQGTLLLATTQDGNFNIFPLAFAVVDSENDEAWEWFFRQLSRVIPDDEALAIISDRHLSIGKAIKNVYPLASRGICTYHLYKNIVLKFRGSESFGLVKKAASAFRLEDFNRYFQQIGALNPELHAYLVRADVSMWTRVHFPGERYNFTTSNIAESINRVLNQARKFPIVELLDYIRSMLTRWFAVRRKQAAAMPTTLTTAVEKLLQARVERADAMKVQEIDPHHYEVRNGATVHVVNLHQNKCTCRRFDVEKIPCEHALAAATTAKVSRISKCHPYFRSDYLYHGYEKSVMPRDTSATVPVLVSTKRVKTPFVRPQSGRPKMTRIKHPLEIAMGNRRPRKRHACSKCKTIGHNHKTCPT